MPGHVQPETCQNPEISDLAATGVRLRFDSNRAAPRYRVEAALTAARPDGLRCRNGAYAGSDSMTAPSASGMRMPVTAALYACGSSPLCVRRRNITAGTSSIAPARNGACVPKPE